jgi:hypothetical protein
MRYRIEVSLAQLRALNSACELLARCGMGQVKDVAFRCDSVPCSLCSGAQDDWYLWRDALWAADRVWEARNGGAGGCDSLGPEGKLAWDLYQVLRHQIAEATFPDGECQGHVWRYPPFSCCDHPLAKIEEVPE